MMERSGFFWTLPRDRAARLKLRDAFVAAGGSRCYLKAGGDDGLAWVAGVPLPDFARPQWSEWADDFPDAIPWFYNWPTIADKVAVVKALAARDCQTIVLNPETEWRWQNSNANPWHSLAEANAAAAAWVNDLRARLPHPVTIGFSSVPTWADFPYEGFVAACDFALPQHYWFARMFTAGENEVAASVRREHIARAGQQFPTVAVLTACREYDDAGVVQLAQEALADDSETAGFSCWEAANAAFQSAAMAQAFALLPADVTAQTKPTPADPGFPGALQADGTTVLDGVDFGGVAVCVEEVRVQVRNAAGGRYRRRWVGHALEAWEVVV